MKWFHILLFALLLLMVACESDTSYLDKARETGDWNYCLKIKSDFQQLSCLDQLTQMSNTPIEMCLIYEDNKNGKNSCYYNLATAKKDMTI